MNDSANLSPEPKKSIFGMGTAVVIIVIMILTVLVFMTVPFIGSQGPARKTISMNNLRNIGLAVVNYSSNYASNMPVSTTTDQQGNPLHGWMTSIIPFLDQVELANQINYEKPWNDPVNQRVFRTSLPSLINPAIDQTTDPEGYALTHYTANSRLIGSQKSFSFDELSNADGLTNTIMLGEINSNFPAWGSTSNFRDPAKGLKGGPDQFGSPYKGSVTVIFADGRAMSLSKDIDPQVLKALSTPDGGEIISEKDY